MMESTSYDLLWLWFGGAFLLGIAIAYGIYRTRRLSRREQQNLNEMTKMRQRTEDPLKR
jgi:uncharacterized membrane-anchored protein YhcB (DUF1043 family)